MNRVAVFFTAYAAVYGAVGGIEQVACSHFSFDGIRNNIQH